MRGGRACAVYPLAVLGGGGSDCEAVLAAARAFLEELGGEDE